jgi:hypothetical protein
MVSIGSCSVHTFGVGLIAHRPTEDRDRVDPCHLRGYRQTNEFVGPCCICALLERNGKYVEAAMFAAPSGPNSGRYVAQCAKGECAYYGELFRPWWGLVFKFLHSLVDLEEIFQSYGTHLTEYPLRGEYAFICPDVTEANLV